MIARQGLAIAAALLLAVQAVRNAAVNALAETRPSEAARIWADHPDVELASGMISIAEAARTGAPIPPSTFEIIEAAARQAPLESEPYLVRGVQAQLANEQGLAEQAFSAAQRRDPRSLPAAYFLAGHYFRVSDSARALDQIATLARLSPAGIQSLAPYLAAYAQDSSTWPRLRAMFRSEPELEGATLLSLASSANNADIILKLVDPQRRTADSRWLQRLVRSLVQAGEYQRAKAISSEAIGASQRRGDLIADFSAASAQPPFDWSLTSSSVGLAERRRGGLHILFYGVEDGVLARQLLVLPPGSYRMTLRVSIDPARASPLSWIVRCDKARDELARAGLDAVATDGWTFTVPAGCRAQWLELAGTASDVPQQIDLTISDLRLTRGNSGA